MENVTKICGRAIQFSAIALVLFIMSVMTNAYATSKASFQGPTAESIQNPII